MIQIMVMYDISVDRTRNKVADTCKDYGLDRWQYSVFAGRLSKRQLRALTKELRHLIENDASILIVQLASDDWEKRIALGGCPA